MRGDQVFEFAGVKIHRISLSEAVERIEGFIATGGRHQVCAANVYSAVKMQTDKEFKEANNSSALVVADGRPLVWVSRLLGRPIPERVAGADLFSELCKIASHKRYTFFFLGATRDMLRDMSVNLKREFPSLQIAGAYAPPFRRRFSEADNLAMIRKVNAARPDILWVGMTAPKQEKWIHQNLERLSVKVAVGVGAVFSFVSGRVKRAPKWMERMGLEWFCRLIHEPRRLWKRYLVGNSVFIWLVIKEFLNKGQ